MRSNRLPRFRPPYRSFRKDFHWAGRGLRLFMQTLAERELGLKPKARATWTEREVPVELSFAFGRWFMHRVEQPDWTASGVEQCIGASECFREPVFAGVDFPVATWRFKRTNGPERLLILGDSFGVGAGGVLIDYFDEVVALRMQQFAALPDDKKDRLWQALALDWRPDAYHRSRVRRERVSPAAIPERDCAPADAGIAQESR